MSSRLLRLESMLVNTVACGPLPASHCNSKSMLGNTVACGPLPVTHTYKPYVLLYIDLLPLCIGDGRKLSYDVISSAPR